MFAQKKVAKEKVTPRSVPAARVPCATRSAGRLAKLACGSDNASRLPPAALRCSAPLKGPGKASTLDERSSIVDSCADSLRYFFVTTLRLVTGAFRVPMRGAEQRRRAGGSRFALSEPQASLANRPACRVAQGTGRSPAPTQGSPFLWLLSFGEAKESTPAPQARNPLPKKSGKPQRPR